MNAALHWTVSPDGIVTYSCATCGGELRDDDYVCVNRGLSYRQHLEIKRELERDVDTEFDWPPPVQWYGRHRACAEPPAARAGEAGTRILSVHTIHFGRTAHELISTMCSYGCEAGVEFFSETDLHEVAQAVARDVQRALVTTRLLELLADAADAGLVVDLLELPLHPDERTRPHAVAISRELARLGREVDRVRQARSA
jgi:hypothetical protein